MLGAGAVFPQRSEMDSGTIACVALPAVVRMLYGERAHQVVAVDLGEQRRGGDSGYERVGLGQATDRGGGALGARRTHFAVEHVLIHILARGDQGDEQAKRLAIGPADVALIDLLGGNRHDLVRDDALAQDYGDLAAARGGDGLRVAQEPREW